MQSATAAAWETGNYFTRVVSRLCFYELQVTSFKLQALSINLQLEAYNL